MMTLLSKVYSNELQIKLYIAKHDILLNEFTANMEDYKINYLYKLVIVV